MAVDERIDEEAGEGDPSILQWMTRRQLADGAEAVEGSVRIHFGPGERSAVAHVSFIPPLSDRPRAECQVLADFDGRVRIGVAQAYGLRIEARRSESASHAISIDVGFSANVRAVQARRPEQTGRTCEKWRSSEGRQVNVFMANEAARRSKPRDAFLSVDLFESSGGTAAVGGDTGTVTPGD